MKWAVSVCRFIFVSVLAVASAAGFALISPAVRERSVRGRSMWSVLRVREVALCAALVVVASTTLAMFEPVLPSLFLEILA